MDEIKKEAVKEQPSVKKATDKAQDALNRLVHGKTSINQLRIEYGLKPIKNKPADLFITKE